MHKLYGGRTGSPLSPKSLLLELNDPTFFCPKIRARENAKEKEVMASPVQATAATQRPCLCRNGGGLYKQFYKTEAEAQAAADRINKEDEGEQEQHPYRCDEGGLW